eukprot:EG_transcript_30552
MTLQRTDADSWSMGPTALSWRLRLTHRHRSLSDLQGPQFIEALTEAFSLSRNSLMYSDLPSEEDLRGEQACPPRSDPLARRATLDRFLNIGTPCSVHPV